ncbi:ceramidase domain-containing protein [Ditylenchus destructor]|nr:ceramidase domain-containing protein [Ditylenchus destructor]
MQRWLEYESGQAWCESSYSKYQIIPFVAEFANTVTNLPIIVLPMVNVLMLRRYIQDANAFVLLPNLLLTINGILSAYYHSTLNLFGQLVDELSLLWLINICVIAYLPIMKCYPTRFKDRVSGIRWAIAGATTLISALCFLKPSLNAFALMTLSIPVAFMIYQEGIKSVGVEKVPEAEKLTWRVFTLWTLASACWFSDRMLCDLWLYLGTPYLHALFHLMSSVAAYHLFIMFSLLDIKRRSHEHNFVAEIKYFPFSSGKFSSFAYISLKEKHNCPIEGSKCATD